MRRIFNHLTVKLLVLVFIIGSVPLSILGGFTFFLTKANMQNSMHQQLEFAVQDARHHTQQLLSSQLQSIHWILETQSADALASWVQQQPLVDDVIATNRLSDRAQLSSPLSVAGTNYYVTWNQAALLEFMQTQRFAESGEVLLSYTPLELDTDMASASAALDLAGIHPSWTLYAVVPRAQMLNIVTQLNIVMWSLWVVAFAVAMTIGYWFSRQLVKPLQHLLARLQNIASGEADLTQRIDVESGDEIGQVAEAFNRFLDKLRGIVNELAQTAEGLASSAQQTSTVSDASQQALDHQHQQVEQVATAMNQMATTVHEVAQNTQEAAHSAETANAATGQGQAVVQQTISSITQLAKEVEQASQVITHLRQDSEKIGGILDTIRGIAEQTNLLALNAAIEAARAGEQGRGFAVVADEVRHLAIRVSDATDEIHSMIQALQHSSESAVAVMQRGQQQADCSVTDAERTGEALQQISHAIQQINGMNLQVASATEEQSTVAEEINRNVVTISELAFSTTQQAQEVAQASASQNRLAQRLQGIVSRFVY